MIFGKWFGRSETGDDIEQELQSHIQHRADDLKSSGLDRAEAERKARIEFGGHGRFKDNGYHAVSFARRDGVAGDFGRDGRDAGGYRYFSEWRRTRSASG